MARIDASYSQQSIKSYSQTDVLERFFRDSGLGSYGTVSGGSTTTLIDATNLKTLQADDQEYVGQWTRISYDAAAGGAAPEGEYSSIDEYTPGQGQLRFSPPFTVAPASGDKYQIFSYIRPQIVLGLLDDLMTTELFIPTWTILTEVPDGDMELSGTDDWTGTNATVTKVSTQPAMTGKRWLKVLTTSANGYAESATLYVEPNTTYHLSSNVRASAGSTTPTMIAYDNTNSAAIKTVTSQHQETVRLWTEFTTPATCYQITVRLSNAEDAVTTYWDEVCLYPVNTREISAPYWFRSEDQNKGVYQFNTYSAGSTGLWDSTYQGLKRQDWDLREDAGRFTFVSRSGSGMSYPLYVFATKNEQAFSDANTDKTSLDIDLLNAGLQVKVWNRIKTLPEASSMSVNRIKEEKKEWEDKYMMLKRAYAKRLEKIMQSPKPEVYYGRNSGMSSFNQSRIIT